MNIQEKIEQLRRDVTNARYALNNCVEALSQAMQDITNHIYENFDEAEYALMGIFESEAHDDCEGSGNCGADTYCQDFIVDGVEYKGMGDFEYNRLDKQFYFVEDSEYSYMVKE